MLELRSWPGFTAGVVIVLIAAAAVAFIVSAALNAVARRRKWPRALSTTVRWPFRAVLVVIGLCIVVTFSWPSPGWEPLVAHILVIMTIAVAAWFVAALLFFAIGVAMARLPIDARDNRVARRRQTQLILVRRLLVAVVSVCALGAILVTFPAVAALGTSILASAGVAGIVAGLAAQSTLASVFAGIQLAFSDAIRVDDVVVVEDEWGRIEEITLTYVVVHIWDDRRLVLPSTYFTSKPFENWTRRSSELLGAVEFDLDWRVSPSQMRQELDDILERTPLWDGRTKVLQVTDAVGGVVRVRILVTAVDAPTLFDLRCFVREEFVEWMHRTAGALPLTRMQIVRESDAAMPVARTAQAPTGLFTGTTEGEDRAGLFTGAIPIAPGGR